MIWIFFHSNVKFRFSHLSRSPWGGRGKHISLERIFPWRSYFCTKNLIILYTAKVCRSWRSKKIILLHIKWSFHRGSRERNRRKRKNKFAFITSQLYVPETSEFSCTIFSLHNSWYNLKARRKKSIRKKNTFTGRSEKKIDKLQALNFMLFINTAWWLSSIMISIFAWNPRVKRSQSRKKMRFIEGMSC